MKRNLLGVFLNFIAFIICIIGSTEYLLDLCDCVTNLMKGDETDEYNIRIN